MNLQLLAILIGEYTALFFLLGFATRPGAKYLQNRFQEKFGQPISEDAVEALAPEQRAEWDRIYFDEYSRTPYRWVEILCSLFHYPSIIVLGVLLKRNAFGPMPMYFITGATYITLLYYFLR